MALTRKLERDMRSTRWTRCGTSSNMSALHKISAAVVAETIRNNAHPPFPDWYWGEVRASLAGGEHLVMLTAHSNMVAAVWTRSRPAWASPDGWLFNHERYGFRPDITTVGKALGGTVVPVAGMIINPGLDLPEDADLGYVTHEKNTMSARAALTTLEILRDDELPDRAKSLGERAYARLEEVREKHSSIREVRSAGLMLALDLKNASPDPIQAKAFTEVVFRACVDGGVLPMFPEGSSVTFSIPLVVDESDLEDSIEVIEAAVQTAENL